MKEEHKQSKDGVRDGNDTQTIKVLVVEDKTIDRRVAQFMLHKLGYHVDFAPNGMEAIKMLEHNSFDLVLMDCVMPVMDGFEAASMIRNPKSPVLNHKVPIIAITAASMGYDSNKYLDAGMDSVIVKPLSLPKLNAAISECLTLSDNLAAAQAATLKAEKAVFDRKDLAERLMNDEELMRDIIEDFLKNLPLQIEALEEAVKNSDTARIPIIIHTIKDPAMTISAGELYKQAQKLEAAINNCNLREMELLMPEFKHAAGHLTVRLKKEIANSAKDKELLHYADL